MEKKITITVMTPIDCTDEQFKEWVRYHFRCSESMSMLNPLHVYDFDESKVIIR